jgi:threonine dehydratase
MSAGNFGRSFSYITGQMGINALIIMPGVLCVMHDQVKHNCNVGCTDNVPVDRIHAIQGYGAQVELALRMVGAAFLILL